MNLQNLPRDDPLVKAAFLPKLDGLVEFDYHQIEPRLFGYFSKKLGDSTVADMYVTGLDVYRRMAAATLSKAEDEVTPKERQDFKVFFLMILYGAGPKKIHETMGMPYSQALDYYKDFHDAWPQVRMISNPPPRKRYPGYEPGAIERVLARKGYIETIAGRRLAPGQWEAHKMLNKLIQGSAAEVMKRALVRIRKLCQANPDWQSHPVLTIHDSVLFDFIKQELDRLLAAVPDAMDEPLLNDTIPIRVDAKVSYTNWAEAKEVS